LPVSPEDVLFYVLVVLFGGFAFEIVMLAAIRKMLDRHLARIAETLEEQTNQGGARRV
jgi:hypothetical protein